MHRGMTLPSCTAYGLTSLTCMRFTLPSPWLHHTIMYRAGYTLWLVRNKLSASECYNACLHGKKSTGEASGRVSVMEAHQSDKGANNDIPPSSCCILVRGQQRRHALRPFGHSPEQAFIHKGKAKRCRYFEHISSGAAYCSCLRKEVVSQPVNQLIGHSGNRAVGKT